MHTHAAEPKRVLEPAESSRTASLRQAEELAAAKLYAALPADKPAGIRPMEAVWILLACFLFMSWLEKSDVSQDVIAEKRLEGCIAQFGPGEHHRNPKFQCAPMVEAPATAMTRPIP